MNFKYKRCCTLHAIIMCMCGCITKNYVTNECGNYREEYCVYECALKLDRLWLAAKFYEDSHGRLPNNDELNEGVITKRLFKCPCVEEDTNRANDCLGSDYMMVDYSKYEGIVPDDYPLFYDSNVLNHQGMGIFVIRYDGQIMWDRKALYLKYIRDNHPEIQIHKPINAHW